MTRWSTITRSLPTLPADSANPQNELSCILLYTIHNVLQSKGMAKQNGISGSIGPCRVASFSGFSMDRFDALKVQAETSGAHFLVGDYLAEGTIASNELAVLAGTGEGYEMQFIKQLEGAAEIIGRKKLKVLTDAGALNPKAMAEKVDVMLKKAGHALKVSYVQGDNIGRSVAGTPRTGRDIASPGEQGQASFVLAAESIDCQCLHWF